MHQPVCGYIQLTLTDTLIHSVVFAERGHSGVVLGHAVRMCDAGVSRDAAHIHRY